MNSYFPRGTNTAPTAVDYDVAAPQIECHADKIGARIYEFEESGHTLRVLALDEESARETAEREFQHNQFAAVSLDLSDDAEVECWCGEKGKASELFDDSGLDDSCGGLGTIHCFCGGDLCVCHYHGEAECPGCRDCEDRDDDDSGDDES